MAGATQATITLTLTGGYTFPTSPFQGTFRQNGLQIANPNFVTSDPTIAVATVNIAITPGPKNFEVGIPSVSVIPNTLGVVGSFTLSFNDVPPTTTLPSNLVRGASSTISGLTTAIIACIHGSSLIVTKNGLKRIDKLAVDDQVLSGSNFDQSVKVKSVAQCWIQHPGPDHDAVIFKTFH